MRPYSETHTFSGSGKALPHFKAWKSDDSTWHSEENTRNDLLGEGLSEPQISFQVSESPVYYGKFLIITM